MFEAVSNIFHDDTVFCLFARGPGYPGVSTCRPKGKRNSIHEHAVSSEVSFCRVPGFCNYDQTAHLRKAAAKPPVDPAIKSKLCLPICVLIPKTIRIFPGNLSRSRALEAEVFY